MKLAAAVVFASVFLFGFLGLFNAQSLVENEISEEDDIVLENWEASDFLTKNYPYYLSGFDDDYRPIWVLEFGKWDLRKLVDDGPEKVKEFDTYADQFFYRIQKSIRKANTEENPVTGWACIFDMEGYNIRQLASVQTVGYVLKLAGKFEVGARNMEYGFLINLNFIAESLINTLRPVLGTTLDRAEIHGTNRARWLPSILKHISNKNAIPEWYGGFKNFTPYAVYG